METETTFGTLVRERRLELGLSQAEVAGRVGCAVVTARKIEAGDLRPSVQMAERLAMALNIPLEERSAFVRQARRAELRTPEPPTTPTPAPSREEIGQEDLSGRAVHGYELGERIGTGGFGVVYRAVQPVVERDVAVKIILPEYANHPDFIRRFEAEARLVARLEHPHIVPLYDYWREPGAAFLVMRLLRGGSLRDLLGKGPLRLEQFVRMIEQIGAALHSAHRYGVIHRDLKPANILLDEEHNAYLADFGIAKNLGNPEVEDQTQIGAMIGSPAYASPEQIRCQEVRPQSDLYCLGVLIFEMLVGNAPFQGPTPVDYVMQHLNIPLPPVSRARPELPLALDAVLRRATAKKADERYADVPALLGELHAALSGVAGIELAAPLDTASEVRNPYKGLRAFGEADAEDFFGRELLVRDLLGRMSEENDLGRFLAVVGPSGSGKSSVVKAGLAPALRRGGLPGSENWFISHMTPGAHPLEELEAALLRVAVNPPASLLAQLQESERGLLRAVRRILPDDGMTELVLIIDQFEELFTLTQSEPARAHFLASLLAAVLEPDSRLHVLVTLRADFTDRPLQYVDFGELVRQRTEFVLPLSPDELEQAINGPARRGGLVVEPGLVSRIVREVGDQPGALPLLQYALTELYEQRDGRRLTQAAYQKIGGVGGALAGRAEQIYSGMSGAEQKAARQVFLRLVTLGEGAEDTRHRVLRSEIEGLSDSGELSDSIELSDSKEERHALAGEAFEGVLEKFGQYRLLTFDHDPREHTPTVEVAHEALLREWPRLRQWLEESRAELRMRRLLSAMSAEWQAAGREESFLLRGTRLDQFVEWAESSSLALTPVESDFLKMSITARKVRQAAEAARQAREAALEQRSRRFLRGLAGALGAAALIAIVLSLLIGQQWRRAEDASQLALAGQQTAVAAGAAAATERSVAVDARAEAEEQRTTAEEQRAEAEAQRINAEQQKALAEEQRQAARVQAAIGLSYAAQRELDSGFQNIGLLLALEALEKYPYTWQAELALSQAVQQSRLRLILAHDGEVNEVAWSPTGDRLATASADNTARIWDASNGKLIFTLDHEEEAHKPRWSPDGTRLVTLSSVDSGALVMWDTQTGEKLYDFGHEKMVNDVSWSPDGRRLVTASDDLTARVWDAQTGKELLTLNGHEIWVSQAAWSPDGNRIVTASGGTDPEWYPVDEETKVMVWDANTGERIFALPGHTGHISSIDFSPAGERFATSSIDGTVRIWNLYTGEELLVIQAMSPITSLDWLSTADYLLTVDEDSAGIWNANTGENEWDLPGYYFALYSPDGTRLLFARDDPKDPRGSRTIFEVWDWNFDHFNLVYTVRGSAEGLGEFAWAPSGEYFASAGVGNAMVWDVRPAESLPIPGGLSFGINWTEAGDRFMATAIRGIFRIWDVATHTVELEITTQEGLMAINMSHAEDRLASGTLQGNVYVWDAATGRQLLKIPAMERREWLTSTSVGQEVFARWSPDDQFLATGGADGLAKIWDAQSGELLLVYSGHKPRGTRGILDLHWLPDPADPQKNQIVSAGADGTVQFWDPLSGETLRTLAEFGGAVTQAVPSPDNRQIATYSVDELMRIFDTQSGELLRAFPSILGSVWVLNWNHPGTRLAIASNSGDALVFDAVKGVPIHRYLIYTASEPSWSPDDSQLVLSSINRVVFFPCWNTADELIAYAKECCVVGELTPEQRQQYGLPAEETGMQLNPSDRPDAKGISLAQALALLALAGGLLRLRGYSWRIAPRI